MAPPPWLLPLSWTLVRHWKKCARPEWHEKSKRSRGKTEQRRRKRWRTRKMPQSLRPWISISGNFPFYLTSKLKALQWTEELKEKHCPRGRLAVTYAHNSWYRIWRLHSVQIRKHGKREGFKHRSMVDTFTTWPSALWECHCKFLGLIAISCVVITELSVELASVAPICCQAFIPGKLLRAQYFYCTLVVPSVCDTVLTTGWCQIHWSIYYCVCVEL